MATGGMSTDFVHRLLNMALRNVAYTPATQVFIALYTSNPTDAGIGTEVTGGGYVRRAIAFAAAANRQVANSALVEFPEAISAWGTVTHVGILTAATAGDLIFHGPLTVAKAISAGEILRFKIGAVVAGVAPSV